jgi:hypothetical protein
MSCGLESQLRRFTTCQTPSSIQAFASSQGVIIHTRHPILFLVHDIHMSNAKNTYTSGRESTEAQSYPAITFSALHKEDMEPDITPLSSLIQSDGKGRKKLFNVVKDHNNATIQDMLDVSNVHCYHNARDGNL